MGSGYIHPNRRVFRPRELIVSVHWAQHQQAPRQEGAFRRLYDFELFYVRGGIVDIAFADGAEYRCTGGHLLLLPSHLPHRIRIPREDGAAVTGVHFDFYDEFDLRPDLDMVMQEGENDIDESLCCALPVDDEGKDLFPKLLSSAESEAASRLDAIVEAFGARRPGFELVCRGLMLQLIAELLERPASAPGSDVRAPSELVEAARRAADRMAADLGASWSNAELARSLNVNEDYFIRLFKKATGSTPYRYLQYARFREAQRLLRDSSLKIAAVGKRVGYDDIHHFSLFFKRWQGVSPQEYRRLCSML